MMVGVIVFFAQEHKATTPQTVNQRSTVDELARRYIPDPPHHGMVLSKGRLPWLSRRTAERQSREERPEHAGTRGPDRPECMVTAQNTHVETPEARYI